MQSLRFLRENIPWLAAGLVLAFASSFGQTFFIGLFGAQFREELGLSHGGFGTLYMGATLLSAFTLVKFGGVADRIEARKLGVAIMVGLGLVCLAMSQVTAVWQLFIVIFGLRFLGQGMLSHLEVTAIARWFAATRGKALAMASWGHPLGEGLLPMSVAALLISFAWREVWLLCAAVLVLALVPIYALILPGEREPRGSETGRATLTGIGGKHWTRPEVLRHRLFWFLIPALMASPLIGTAALFHQAHITEIKGWTLAQFAAGFPVYAVVSIVFSLVFGVLVDRFSARAMLAFHLLPLALGMAVLGLFDGPWVALFMLGAIGGSAGAGMATVGAMWAELYGTEHLGSIRSLSVAGMVFSSALGPGLTGVLIDAGIPFDAQSVGMSLIILAMAALMWVLMRGVR